MIDKLKPPSYLRNKKIEKGYILRQDNKKKMSFMYNPTTFDYTRSATYTSFRAPGASYPSYQYVGGEALTFSTDLFLYCADSSKKTKNEVEKAIDFIEGLFPPEKNAKKKTKPPEFIFCLGKFTKRCIATDYNVHIETWDRFGNVTQATVTLGVTQVGVK
jgi:hypothetical protein